MPKTTIFFAGLPQQAHFPTKSSILRGPPFDFIDLRQMNCRKSCAAILPAAMTSAPQSTVIS